MWALAFGARTGVRMTLMFSLARRVSKARGNFASRSWIRKRTVWSWSSSSNQKVARLLQHPGGVGLAGAGEVRNSAASDREEDEHVEAAQPNRVDSEEVAGEDRVGMCSQEAAPRLRVAPRGRRQSGGGEDVANRGR